MFRTGAMTMIDSSTTRRQTFLERSRAFLYMGCGPSGRRGLVRASHKLILLPHSRLSYEHHAASAFITFTSPGLSKSRKIRSRDENLVNRSVVYDAHACRALRAHTDRRQCHIVSKGAPHDLLRATPPLKLLSRNHKADPVPAKGAWEPADERVSSTTFNGNQATLRARLPLPRLASPVTKATLPSALQHQPGPPYA
ncbi:hypothetical protein BD311DRAFT_249762 [Dichomitus squalens]|uniref:Uncharacterized protein n=1 Tax=Dichomitus squalens TaxID=114155 RepID=A0A4Q9MQK6_9APHY|nr:hypothetical protein BD311DRAFT_249762 [Dichomitus squalens]